MTDIMILQIDLMVIPKVISIVEMDFFVSLDGPRSQKQYPELVTHCSLMGNTINIISLSRVNESRVVTKETSISDELDILQQNWIELSANMKK